ncbi:MAG: HAMP domain-containing histidine kinase [Acidimicrobiia bacterium]|nr:HAMP domain-containing histidine kinase [Acidimicrobiia bacterium]NNF09677.1 HAMP domain-containing histidine kinase [Acidimicrobiia bacterium]NNL68774.1 HAMP domain-containing histidine kinase [Acidimicrobiia bacterium]
MRIRARLALYGATVTAIAMLAFGILLGVLVSQGAPNDQEQALRDLADQAVAALNGLTAESVAATTTLAPVDIRASTDSFIQITDPEGTTLYATGVLDDAPVRVPAAAVVEATETGASTVVFTPATDVQVRIHATPWTAPDGELLGIVIAGQPTAFVDEQITGLQAVLWVTGIITLLAASIVAWLVSGRALKPLQDLVETTDGIGETGDLSRRLPPNASRDEVGRLTTSFNAMLAELETSQRRLAQSLEAQQRFVADASHELRSPLTTIRNNAGFLVDRPDAAAADRTEALADITAEAERMTRLVDDMLTLALADTDAPLARAPVDLSAVVHDATHRAGRHDLPVTLTAGNAAVVMGDRDELERLVWILIDNAAKHGWGDIDVVLSTGDETATIEVSDEGPGIPHDQLTQVFDRFHRVDDSRSPAGAGLGLAIARGIVDAHGGTIGAENSGDGATFRVQLPLAH